MAVRRNSVPAYQQRQQQRKERHANQQQLKKAARAKLPWVLAGLGLVILLMLAGSGLLWYRASRPLANLTRADVVVSWVEIRRSATRYHPYELRFATYEQSRIMEVFLGQSEELAAYYTHHLRVGDSVRVYYNEDIAKGSPLVYQIEEAGRVLLSAEDTQTENNVGAVAFGLLGLLPLALCLSNRNFRTAIKSYFRSNPA